MNTKLLDKFAPRSKPGIFVGYPRGPKGYRVYDLENQNIYFSRDVQFFEDIFSFANGIKSAADLQAKITNLAAHIVMRKSVIPLLKVANRSVHQLGQPNQTARQNELSTVLIVHKCSQKMMDLLPLIKLSQTWRLRQTNFIQTSQL